MSYWENKEKYKKILQEFVDYKVSSSEFTEKFTLMWKADRDEEFQTGSHESLQQLNEFEFGQLKSLENLLSEIFSACDVFEPDDTLREDYEYDEAGLKDFVSGSLLKYFVIFDREPKVLSNELFSEHQFRKLLGLIMHGELSLLPNIKNKNALSLEDIEADRKDLIQQSVISNREMPQKYIDSAKKIIMSGWKLMLDIKSDNNEWSQGFLHFSADAIVGELLNEQKDRLISDMRSVEEAGTWLADTLPVNRDGTVKLPPQSLESLSDQLTAVIRMAILNTSDQQPAKAAGGWLVTAESMWFVDEQSKQKLAENISGEELSKRITTFIQSHVPQNTLPQPID